MAENNEVTVEELSPTPLQPIVGEEEEQEEEVSVEPTVEPLPGQPQPDEQGFVTPPRPVAPEPIAEEIKAQQPGVEVEILPGDFDPTAETRPEFDEGQPIVPPEMETDRASLRTAGPNLTPEPTTADGDPILPPARFEDRASNPNLSDQEFAQIKTESYQFYYDQILGGNGDPEKRMEAINRASYYRVPLVDQQGNVVYDENNRVIYDSQPIPFISDDPELRVIQLFEMAQSNNGFYHFFEGPMDDPEAQTFGQLDIGLQKMLQGNQSPITSFFYRVESEEGGMRNYTGILKDVGINDPSRLTYIARQQAQAGPFSGIELTRMGAGVRDTVKFLADLGFGDGFQIPYTDTRVGLGAPLQEFTATIPFYLYQAFDPETYNPLSGPTPYQDIVQSDVPKRIRQITQGSIPPWQMDDAVTVLKSEYPHATEAQLEAILNYSPDLVTLSKRWATESLLTSGSALMFMRGLAKAERNDFLEFVREQTGNKDGIEGVSEALVELDRKGIDSNKLIAQYYESKGMSDSTSRLLAKSFDEELQMAARRPGPYRDEIIEPKLEEAKGKLARVDEKLDAALETGNEDLIRTLTAQKQLLQRDVISLKDQSYVPKYMRDYLVDEGIATGVAATAYQFVYDVGGENPTTSSIAALAFGVSSAFPGVREIAVNGTEDVFTALSSNLNSKQSKAAIRIRRHLEKAPPELRENILLFMERKAIATEEMAQLKFPEGHPRAGEPVIEPGLLDRSFAQMSGLVSLRRLEGEVTQATVNIQKDAGRLSQNLLDLEKNYMQQSKLIDGLAQSIDALRYYRFSDQYIPGTESANMTNFLIDFYDQSLESLTTRKNRLNDALDKRDADMQRFFNGTLDPDELEGYLDGTEALSNLIALDRARYVELGLSPDASAQEIAARQQAYFVGLNSRVAESINANSRFTFDADAKSTTANNDLRNFVTVQEAEAYGEASQKFDALRANPLYQDLRMDMTDVLTAFADQGPDGALGINTHAISQFVPLYGQGTQSSRYLANKNVDVRTSRALAGLFGESAGEYLDDLSGKIGQDTLDSIYAKAEISGDASNLDRWFAVRDWFDANKDKFGDQFEELYPRLGVDPATFMHVVSGLGKSGSRPEALAHRQLREDLLNRAESEFYDNFYEPKSARSSVSGFSDDYQAARQFYKKRYITPFREESSVVASLVRTPESKVRRNALDGLMKELGAADAGVDLITLRENFYKVLEDLTGGPIDVKTPKGQAIRGILTKYVQEEIARQPGAGALRNYLAQDRAQGNVSTTIIPANFGKIESELTVGGTPVLDNLLRRDKDGNYLFADVNGEPLVDPAMANPLSYDDLLGYGVREAQVAQVELNARLEAERKALTREMEQQNTRISREIEARKSLTVTLRANKEGLGKALVDLTGRTGGVEEITQLRQDFIYAQTLDGQMDAGQAGAVFDDVVRDATLDHVMSQIMEPGAEMPMRTVDPATGEQRMVVQRGVELNLNNLASVLGIRGDTVTEAPQAKAMRALLGEETVAHMRFVFEELFQYDPRTGALNVTGTSVPLSAESMLSRGTSFARGVISMRWLLSEAAIRSSREANYQLTKLMLGDPQVGREVVDMLMSKNFNLDKREPEFIPVLLSQIAKNDALQELALRESQGEPSEDTQMQTLPQSSGGDQPSTATSVDTQMNQLIMSP